MHQPNPTERNPVPSTWLGWVLVSRFSVVPRLACYHKYMWLASSAACLRTSLPSSPLPPPTPPPPHTTLSFSLSLSYSVKGPEPSHFEHSKSRSKRRHYYIDNIFNFFGYSSLETVREKFWDICPGQCGTDWSGWSSGRLEYIWSCTFASDDNWLLAAQNKVRTLNNCNSSLSSNIHYF